MADIVVRNLDEDVKLQLKQRAAANNRSMEAEVRAILRETVAQSSLAQEWLKIAEDFRGVELPIPARSAPRTIGFES